MKKLKVGDKVRAAIPFGREPMLCHITYILPSPVYSDVTLIIYKVFGKHKRWWHEFMCTEEQMLFNMEMAKVWVSRK